MRTADGCIVAESRLATVAGYMLGVACAPNLIPMRQRLQDEIILIRLLSMLLRHILEQASALFL
jgi:hypothetical protein